VVNSLGLISGQILRADRSPSARFSRLGWEIDYASSPVSTEGPATPARRPRGLRVAAGCRRTAPSGGCHGGVGGDQLGAAGLDPEGIFLHDAFDLHGRRLLHGERGRELALDQDRLAVR